MKTRIIFAVAIIGVIFSIMLFWTIGSLTAYEISEYVEGSDENLCEQIGGNPNHPEYEGCVMPSIVCDESFDFFTNDECQTGQDLCKGMGGKVVESLSCRDSIMAEYQELEKPAPCEFRSPIGCEFPK